MAFSPAEIHNHLVTLETGFWAYRRPPLQLRHKIREGQRIAGPSQSIELFFERPAFQRPGEWVESSIAKMKYLRNRDVWKLYWKRADGRWHRYPHCPETETLCEALAVIEEDAYCCFFG